MMINKWVGAFCFSLVLSTPALAQSWPRAVGWHWYDQFMKNKSKAATKSHPSAIAQMDAFRNAVREAKAKAILVPSEKNVATFLMLQKVASARAMAFARIWQKTLLDFPALDFSLQSPTENNAQAILYAKRHTEEEAAIRLLSQHYGLFFFYRGKNSLDQALAPTVLQFCKENKIALIPVSVDHHIIKTLPGSREDHGQAKRLGLHYFPALMLVNPKAGEVKPLNYGFIAGDELRRRFLEVATHFNQGV